MDYDKTAAAILDQVGGASNVGALEHCSTRLRFTLVDGGKARGEALAKAFVTDRYHQPADEYSPDWNLTGAAQDAALLFDFGQQLANSTTWPEWKAGSEFKAERDKSAGQRK